MGAEAAGSVRWAGAGLSAWTVRVDPRGGTSGGAVGEEPSGSVRGAAVELSAGADGVAQRRNASRMRRKRGKPVESVWGGLAVTPSASAGSLGTSSAIASYHRSAQRSE